MQEMSFKRIAFRKRLAAVALLLLVHAVAFGQQQQTPPTVTEQSYRRARPVLDAAIVAYGGLDALRSIENFTVRFEGQTVQRNQSRRPEPPYDRTPLGGFLILEPKQGRVSHEIGGGYPGGFSYRSRLLVNGKDGARLNVLERRATPFPNPPPGVLRVRLRWLPHNLLLNALERNSRLRSLGAAVYMGRPHDVITYPNEDGLQLTLYLDSATHLLSKFEYMDTDAYSGDTAVETIFPAHRALDKFRVPTGRTLKVAGEVTEELTYTEVAFNQTNAEDVFKTPEGYTVAPAPAATPAPATKLAEGVYVVNARGYNVLAVGFKDHILVVESPGGEAASREAIDRIKEAIPGKPFKYLAVTHHHDDHAGGTRTYMGEGVTLVTTPGNRRYFEQMARGVFTLDPDTLARNPRPPSIETVQNKKRVFADATQTVELYDIGPGPHTEEMLVAYLPKERIIFQGDLLNRPADGHAVAGNDTTAHFATWLDKSGLAVERIVAVHGPVSTMDDFRQALALMRKSP